MCFFRKRKNGDTAAKAIAEELVLIQVKMDLARVQEDIDHLRKISEAAEPITDEPPEEEPEPTGPSRIGTTGAGPMLTPLGEDENQDEEDAQ